MTHSRLLPLLALIALLTALLPVGAAAQAPEPTVRDLKLAAYDDAVVDLLPRQGPAAAAESAAAPLSVEGNPTWGRLAYQAYVGGNYEIMLARADMTVRGQLTNDAKADVEPRLNRGATTVVFASNRPGNYDIYRVDVDGGNLRQLTTDSRADRMPDWSGDGARVVFASQRDQNFEIYVMNADGSAQTRLTVDPANDVSPTWSPDGTRIAWVRQNGANGRLWVMNADGTDAHPITGDWPLLENPDWSPDSRQLAFDCDANGDGWTEAVVMNADGTGDRVVGGMGWSGRDTWMGSWSPNSRALMVTRVLYVAYQGQLYIDHTEIEEISLTSEPGRSYGGPDYAMMPDWQSEDITPPNTSMSPLPAYARAFGVPVRWGGYDIGYAGLVGYDAQVKVGDGAWTEWKFQTLATNATYTGAAGSTVYFRVRGLDDAGNLEPWPAGNGDTWTTLYTWNFSGRLTDNRGRPLPRGEVTLAPAGLTAMSTGADGAFGTRLTGTGAHALGVNRPGYAGFNGEALDISADRNLDLSLRPLDDAVANGGFEAADALAGWTRSGSLSAGAGAALASTGKQSARIESACAFPCLTQPQIVGAYNLVATDPAGNFHMVYGSGEFFHSYRTPQGQWIGPEKIASSDSGWPEQLAVDAQGGLHVTWSGRQAASTLYLSEKLPGATSWTEPYPVALGEHSKLHVDATGRLRIVYRLTRISNGEPPFQYRERTPAGVWQAPQAIELGAHDENLNMVVTPDGVTHLLWDEWSQDRFSNVTWRVVSRTVSPDGVWSPKDYVLTEKLTAGPRQLRVGPDGEIVTVWQDAHYNVVSAVQWPGAPFSAPVTLIEGYEPSSMAVDPEGALHIVATNVGNDSTIYRRLDRNGTLSPIASLLHNSYSRPVIAVDPFGIVHIALVNWTDTLYFTSLPATASASGALGQQVTIPAGAHRPTLAFRYRLLGALPGGSSAMARIADGPTVMEVALPTQGAASAFRWADVTAFAGKTVTVSFLVNQAAGQPPARLFIDDVSLGSWRTPVIASVTPAQADGNAGFTLTITGENFIRDGATPPQVRIGDAAASSVTWVDDKTLTVTTPALKPGRYAVWVTNPGGQEAAAAGALAVGRQSYLPSLTR